MYKRGDLIRRIYQEKQDWNSVITGKILYSILADERAAKLKHQLDLLLLQSKPSQESYGKNSLKSFLQANSDKCQLTNQIRSL